MYRVCINFSLICSKICCKIYWGYDSDMNLIHIAVPAGRLAEAQALGGAEWNVVNI